MVRATRNTMSSGTLWDCALGGATRPASEVRG